MKIKYKSKLRVGILFGGKSAEHEVSLQSAKNVFEALDKDKYAPVLIGIDKQGRWQLQDNAQYLLNASNPKLIKLNKANGNLAIVPGEQRQLVGISRGVVSPVVDVVFPVLHGPLGEDGTVQGLLKLLGVPFVGAGVLGSAVGMDKDVMKRLFREAGIPTARLLVFHTGQRPSFTKVKKAIGMPVFVKPANLGSSVGISKARNQQEFKRAVSLAFKFDNKILVEQFVRGREIECAVLGNDHPKASLPGEIIPKQEFYSYEAKYIDDDGAELIAPVKLSRKTTKAVQVLAIRAFQALDLEGMARVDMFLRQDGSLVVNELNTIPGFTKISMFPKLWAASGVPYPKLINRLIQLALARHAREKRLKTSY